jgi:hypothetical protein
VTPTGPVEDGEGRGWRVRGGEGEKGGEGEGWRIVMEIKMKSEKVECKTRMEVIVEIVVKVKWDKIR